MTTTPASSAQVSYLRSLVAERDTAAMLAEMNVTADQWIDAITTDKRLTSKAIDALRKMPKAAQAAGAAPAVRTNRYAATCSKCGTRVEAGAGVLTKVGNKWGADHLPGQCRGPLSVNVPEVGEGLYLSPSDGQVWKVYVTQSGRLGVMTPDLDAMARRQAAKARGEHVARSKALTYVKGGMRLVGERAAVGDLRPMTQDEAARFGRIHAACCVCGLGLDDDRSVAAGYGPVCARNLDWHYPTLDEAAAILGREVTDSPAFEVVAEGVYDAEADAFVVDDGAVDDSVGCEDCADPADVIPGHVCRECLAARKGYDEEPF